MNANDTYPDHHSGIAVDAAGNLFVANSKANNVVRFSPDGLTSSVFAADGLNNPAGLVFDKAGNLYVANSHANTIIKYSPDGQRRRSQASPNRLLMV